MPTPAACGTIGGPECLKGREGMATVVLVGTLDTKGAVYAWMRDRLRAHGCDVVLVDTGILASGRDVPVPDVGAEEVARAAGCELRALRAAGDRGATSDLERGEEGVGGEVGLEDG